jgi:hypothetical protein
LQSLSALHRGVDPDRPVQRRAAARFVGLEMPAADVPLAARAPEELAGAYSSQLQERAGDISKLTGLDNLKAQYYGAEAVLPKLPGVGKKAQV